jgi:cystathionine beta-lyase/cystathionine gamma-synthase
MTPAVTGVSTIFQLPGIGLSGKRRVRRLGSGSMGPRLSIGLEDADDLIADLAQAL